MQCPVRLAHLSSKSAGPVVNRCKCDCEMLEVAFSKSNSYLWWVTQTGEMERGTDLLPLSPRGRHCLETHCFDCISQLTRHPSNAELIVPRVCMCLFKGHGTKDVAQEIWHKVVKSSARLWCELEEMIRNNKFLLHVSEIHRFTRHVESGTPRRRCFVTRYWRIVLMKAYEGFKR
jgi:hypothetical protein